MDGNLAGISRSERESTSAPARRRLRGRGGRSGFVELQHIGTRRLFGLLTGGSYIACGLLGSASLLLNLGDFPHPPALTAIAILCFTIGSAVAVFGSRLPWRAYQAILAFGTLLISLAIAFRGGGVASLDCSYFYLFPAIGSVFFFPRAQALFQVCFVEVCSLVTFSSLGVSETQLLIGQGSTFLLACAVHLITMVANTADTDALTGVGNRRRFDARLAHAIQHARRTGETLSVALLDFDGFKAVNDTDGHAAGDDLLRAVTTTWRRHLDGRQLLCRQGGDEFALILPAHTADQACVATENLRRAVSGLIACSIGIAQLRDQDSQTKLISRADRALYKAKGDGGARVSVHLRPEEQGTMVQDALARGEFEIHYQPVIDLLDGGMIGNEALLRWNDPERGLVSPDQFIPVAERSGSIDLLGQWTLRQACADTAARHVATGEAHTIAVNASGHELRNPHYAAQVMAALLDAGLPASALIIEVTESTLDADQPEVIETLTVLRDWGIGIAIDDFGTGYSTLHRLDQLPATALKVDRRFIDRLDGDHDDATVLKAILALASALDLTVVAEGVERASQVEILTNLGCRHAQGFFFGAPEPVQAQEPTHRTRRHAQEVA